MADLEIQNKHGIKNRLRVVQKNSTDLRDIESELKSNTLVFNQHRAIRGVDANDRNLAPLKQSTLERRHGSGPPLAPDYANSGIVTQCRVEVHYAPGVAIVEKSWPGLKWLKHAITGNAHMAPRDPTGFSQEEKQSFGKILERHVSKKG